MDSGGKIFNLFIHFPDRLCVSCLNFVDSVVELESFLVGVKRDKLTTVCSLFILDHAICVELIFSRLFLATCVDH